MANKRSRCRKTPTFSCPHCNQRLWRNGSQKHYLFYQGSSDIKANLNLSTKNAKFLAARGVYVDRSSWLEEFFCGEHGRMWLLLKRKEDGSLVSTPAKAQHWKQSTGTPDPERPNPSVSDFTYRMSRRTSCEHLKLQL